MSPLIPAPRWSGEELDVGRAEAVEEFRRERLTEPLEDYLEAFDLYRDRVEELLEQTGDLSQLTDQAVEVLTDEGLKRAVRYLAGPPISEDDLETVAETAGKLTPKRLRGDPVMARRVIDTVLLALDRRRFPWVVEGREPTEPEREAAALASASLLATQRVATKRRTTAKIAQEDRVADRLLAAGFTEIATPASVPTLEEAPARGQFCRETILGERKADLLVGLWDGRKMPLECKVSNSEINSLKRVNNDAAVKASGWLQDFGRTQVVPGAVLSGVFKRSHLEAAQGRGLTIWWAHNLDALARWIESTRRGR